MDRNEAVRPPTSRVLLVEDDASTRGMILRYLRGGGYDVTAVDCAEKVIFDLDSGNRTFDVVVSDVHLPGMSGIDLASYLLGRDATQPIVLITGDPDEALAREALSRGPVSYLLKPFELFELDAAVRQATLRRGGGQPVVTSPVTQPAPELAAGAIPEDWLEFVDERSYAGAGHAERVAKVAAVLVSGLAELALDATGAELALAARMHEIGRLAGPQSDPVAQVEQGARMLVESGFPEVVASAVRHLHERWDGSGGPARLSGSAIPATAQVLAAADSLDHYCSAWMQAGMRPLDAVDRAVSLVVVQQGSLFSPVVAAAVHRERSAIRSILAVDREREQPAGEAETRPRSLRLA
ncbi:MAG TPA: response regulator [Gemmatimonadaceae bacterium]|nr:response regulator [Gemmatimonadaceae bacterium]